MKQSMAKFVTSMRSSDEPADEEVTVESEQKSRSGMILKGAAGLLVLFVAWRAIRSGDNATDE